MVGSCRTPVPVLSTRVSLPVVELGPQPQLPWGLSDLNAGSWFEHVEILRCDSG